jgi:Flp pilus assembly protein TadB
MNSSIKIIAVLSLLFIAFTCGSCKGTEESAREYERMEKKMAKEEEKSYNASKKEHLQIQSKATRKMMHESKRKAKKLNRPKKR